MEPELARLIARAERIARTGARLTAAFTAELVLVWRQWERAIVADAPSLSSASVVSLRARVRGLLARAGYDALVAAAAEAGVLQMSRAVLGGVIPRVSLDVQLEALRRIASVDLLAQGDDAAHAIWRAVVQAQVTRRPVAEILAELGAVLDRKASAVSTLFDTQTAILGRQVEALQSEALPDDQPYLFAGPIDLKTRDWCLERVGQVLTRGAIDALDNGQLPNTFLTGGGYNCRHVWLAVESRALRALADTGGRAPEYAADVSRVRSLKAARKKNAA